MCKTDSEAAGAGLTGIAQQASKCRTLGLYTRAQIAARRKKMSGGIDPVLLLILVLIVSAIAWTYWQVQVLNRRLTALEKEHLALVAELEERLYRPS